MEWLLWILVLVITTPMVWGIALFAFAVAIIWAIIDAIIDRKRNKNKKES